LIAGNAYLAEAAQAPEKTAVIPTSIDTDRFRPPLARRSSAAPVIGWMGTASNYPNFAPLLPALQDLLASGACRLRIVSDAPPPFSLPGQDFIPWSEAIEVEALHGFDIGIMPLLDTAWNRGKCAFKLIQYQATGL